MTYSNLIYGENTTLEKTYYTVPVLLKYFTVKNITTNVISGDFSVYLLDFNKITTNSSISNFVIPTTVSNTIQSQQMVANYSVGYNFSIYNPNNM